MLIHYRRQRRDDEGNVHIESAVCEDDLIVVATRTYSEEFDTTLNKFLTNVDKGICHYTEGYEPWVQRNLQLKYI